MLSKRFFARAEAREGSRPALAPGALGRATFPAPLPTLLWAKGSPPAPALGIAPLPFRLRDEEGTRFGERGPRRRAPPGDALQQTACGLTPGGRV